MPRGKKGIGAPRGGVNLPPINLEQVEELAAIQCTAAEICAVLKISRASFTRLKKREAEFAAAVERGSLRGFASIRRWQHKLLEAGNATMGVWLGKQYLGQRDKAEFSGPNGRDLIPLEVVDAILKAK